LGCDQCGFVCIGGAGVEEGETTATLLRYVRERSNVHRLTHPRFGPLRVRPWKLREKRSCFSRPETSMRDPMPARMKTASTTQRIARSAHPNQQGRHSRGLTIGRTVAQKYPANPRRQDLPIFSTPHPEDNSCWLRQRVAKRCPPFFARHRFSRALLYYTV
jgi:hypothetical protein